MNTAIIARKNEKNLENIAKSAIMGIDTKANNDELKNLSCEELREIAFYLLNQLTDCEISNVCSRLSFIK